MKSVLIKVVIFGAQVAILFACGVDSKASKPAIAKGAKIVGVCDKEDIPEGWVVVEHDTSMECPNFRPEAGRFNQYVIKKAGKVENVCLDSPIPKGYARTKRFSSMSCNTPTHVSPDYKNTYRIEKI